MLTDLALYGLVFVISGLIFLPLHALSVRAIRGTNPIFAVNLAIVVSAVAAGAIVWLSCGGLFSSEGAKAVACIGGGISFLGFGGVYNLLGPTSVDRSISAHMVNVIYQAPGHRMTKEDLLGYYTHEDVFEKRFTECVEAGVIERQGSQLTLTPRGRRISLIFAIMGKAVGIRPWYLDRYRARHPTA
jgi:hypothetical protein